MNPWATFSSSLTSSQASRAAYVARLAKNQKQKTDMNAEANSRAALLVSPDLLFAGKVQAAAGPLGLTVFSETNVECIGRVLAEHRVCIVLFDLNLSSPRLAEVLELLPADRRPLFVAYGPHVNTLRLEEARTAGCDRVLPRSRFAVELPELLRSAVEEA